MSRELQVTERLSRRRSPLVVPLAVVVVLGLGFLGWRTFGFFGFGEDQATAPEPENSAGTIEDSCLPPSVRFNRLGDVDRSTLTVAEPTLWSRDVVSGSVADADLRADGSIAVNIRIDDAVSPAGQAVRWLALPSRQPVFDALGVGTEFVALVADIQGDLGRVVPDGFFFACNPSDSATSYRFEQKLSLFEVEVEIANEFSEQVSVEATPRSSGGPALRVNGQDGSEIAVFLPEGTDLGFEVRSFPFPDPPRTLDVDEWPVLFSNGDLLGRLRSGTCFSEAVCGGPLRMEIESRTGELLVEGFEIQVLRVSELGRVLSGAFFARPDLIESANLLVAVESNRELPIDQRDRVVQAYDYDSLELRWETELDGAGRFLSSSPGPAPKILLQVRKPDSKRLVALDLDGSPAWEREIELGGGVFPASDHVVVVENYFGNDTFGSDTFVAVNAEDGTDRWRVEDRPGGLAAEVDGYVFWAGGGRFTRVDPDSGTTMWDVRRGGLEGLTIVGDTVDLGDAGSFDLETGARRRAPGRSPAG